jgi:hypothetical protein
MNRDTDLIEVARHLPVQAAEILRVQPSEIQENVLVVVRDLICAWEESGAQFDPIQWELVLAGVVQVVTPLQVDILNQETLVTMMLGAE